jgi:hypothetical protein
MAGWACVERKRKWMSHALDVIDRSPRPIGGASIVNIGILHMQSSIEDIILLWGRDYVLHPIAYSSSVHKLCFNSRRREEVSLPGGTFLCLSVPVPFPWCVSNERPHTTSTDHGPPREGSDIQGARPRPLRGDLLLRVLSAAGWSGCCII